MFHLKTILIFYQTTMEKKVISGFIYIISSQSYAKNIYKIGITKQPEEALVKAYRRALGDPKAEIFVDVKTIANARDIEKKIQAYLKCYRVYPKHELFRGKLETLKRACFHMIANYQHLTLEEINHHPLELELETECTCCVIM
jgi:hypothetical protein